MVDTFCEDTGAHSDRMSDVASSDHPVASSGRPSCSSCSGSSRPSSGGGGSTFRQKCSNCKMKHHKRQPCRQNAVDAEPMSLPSDVLGARTVVSLRVPPSGVGLPGAAGHFEVGRASSLHPSTASESSGHGSRHRKCSQCGSATSSLSRKRHSEHRRSGAGHSHSSNSKDPGANLLSNIKALFNNWLEKSRAAKSAGGTGTVCGSCSGSGGPTSPGKTPPGLTLANGDVNVSGPSLPSPRHQTHQQQQGAMAGAAGGHNGPAFHFPGGGGHHHHHHHHHSNASGHPFRHQACQHHPPAAPGPNCPPSCCYLNVACPQFPQECTPDDLACLHNVISLNSSFDSDYLLHYYNNVSSSLCSTGCHSTASIPTTLSTTTNSEPPSAAGVEGMDLNLLTASGPSGPNGRYWETHVDYDVLLRRNPRLMGKQFLSAQHPLVPSLSCPTKSKSLQSHAGKQKDLLCSTWPPSGKRVFLPETEEEFQIDHDDVLIEHVGPSQFAKEHLYEFNIPFSDIKFTECLKTGSCRKIHRGQWHGEVMIHTYDHLNHKEISKFWEEVQKLSMIRHENIALFMGASMEPPNFAVVTETRKGCSLYEKLHVSREKTSQSFKLNVLRQLAQAVGYLHAKGMVVRRLNSKHIFLEPKVKVCLLDFSALEDEDGKDNSLTIHTSMTFYMAPEILTASYTENGLRFCNETVFTNASDVFAFGTIMFEVQTNRYPFNKLNIQRLMECICEGKREDTKELRCSDTVKNLIQDCWSHDPLYRPELCDINKELQHRNAAHKRHSSSEPENLHRLTFGKLSYL